MAATGSLQLVLLHPWICAHHATSRPGQGDGIGAAADAADQQEGTETWPVAMAMPTFFFL